ncbi:hypothetical protein ABZT04_43065 [Streptomyces sp. NPDC005492]|uniref:hypothetical protein n=1 Tax=Streptomyces sp. NPDC005492 TaxID=3156883 RepID=UPI0033A13CFC
MAILLVMTIPLCTRVYVMTMVVLVSVVGIGACLGTLVANRPGAVVGSCAAGLGTGFGMLLRHRPAVAAVREAGLEGHVAGLSDVVLMSIAIYEAAVFPLISDGVSADEREARRTIAYRLAAYDDLPRSVRVSAAAALEAIDEGADAARARAAVKELSLTIYTCRSSP